MFLNMEAQAKQSCFVIIATASRSPHDKPEPPASQRPTKTHLAFKTRLIFSSQLFPVDSVHCSWQHLTLAALVPEELSCAKLPSKNLLLGAACLLFFAAMPPELTLFQPRAVPGHLPLCCSGKSHLSRVKTSWLLAVIYSSGVFLQMSLQAVSYLPVSIVSRVAGNSAACYCNNIIDFITSL